MQVSLSALWLPILLSAVFVFIASNLLWMALPFWHRKDYQRLPDEAAVLAALKSAKSGQYIPQRSQPLHFSEAMTCGGWYPLELNAEESESTLVGQNSTQNPHPLHRSTVIDTEPLAMANE